MYVDVDVCGGDWGGGKWVWSFAMESACYGWENWRVNEGWGLCCSGLGFMFRGRVLRWGGGKSIVGAAS